MVKKKPGDSNQQVINEFKSQTMFDEVLEKVKQQLMEGHITEAEKRKRRKLEQKKLNERRRRQYARRQGYIKR